MQAGKLRHRIHFLSPIPSRGPRGQDVLEWAESREIAANVEQLSSREQVRRLELKTEATWSVTIRYRAGLTSRHRIRYGERMFEIVSMVDFEQRKKTLIISCKEHVVGPV